MKKRYILLILFAVVGLFILHFILVFNVPSYKKMIVEAGHAVGAIQIQDLRQADIVSMAFDSLPVTKGKCKITFDKEVNMVITLDVYIGDQDAFKRSCVSLRNEVMKYFKDNTRPFIIICQNYTLKLPENE